MFSDPYDNMFQDVMKSLVKKVGKRTNLIKWLEENETFLWEKIEEGQDMISEAYKVKETMSLEQFGYIIKDNFWDKIKEGIKRYDSYGRKEKSGRTNN